MNYLLEMCSEAGVEEMIIVVGYRAREVKRVVGKEFAGMDISYIVQERVRGTGDAVRCAEARGGPVIAVAGEGDREVEKFCTEVIRVPEVDHRLPPRAFNRGASVNGVPSRGGPGAGRRQVA